jgi:Rrf2 family protein
LAWSLTTEYALRAVVSLAAAAPGPRTTAQIAADTKVPTGYLAKVLQILVGASIVHSQRGIKGGFTLARTPERITALDVVNAVEPIRRIRECPLGRAEHASALCPLHRRMDSALAALERVYKGVSLASLVERPGHSPLCGEKTVVRPRARKRR